VAELEAKYLAELKKERTISGKLLEEFARLFGKRFWQALKVVAERRVKRYTFEPSKRSIWVVVGREKDYLIFSDFYCSCRDFYLNAVVRRRIRYCYHLLAKVIAKSLGIFEALKASDERYGGLMKEWKLIPETTIQETE
jgi:predicted nucleic acid-binding Zn finger protein